MTGGPADHSVKSDVETFPAITGPIIQRAMQRGWELIVESEDGAKFGKRRKGIKARQAIVTAVREFDERVWVHLSASVIRPIWGGKTKLVLPSWEVINEVRDDFLGPDAKCILVVAPAAEHVNLAEVHHIWHCPEGDGLPDFTRGSGSI